MVKTHITPRAQHADKMQTFLNDIANAIEVFEDKIGSMSSAIKQKAYKNFLLSYREALTPIWNLVQFARPVSPDQYTMILYAAALPQIQLVVPGTMLSPMAAPPPPEPQPSTAQGRESIISYTKSHVLPNPHSTALTHIDKNSATRVLAAATYTKLEHKYFDTTLSRADTATAFGCNISQLTKAVTRANTVTAFGCNISQLTKAVTNRETHIPH